MNKMPVPAARPRSETTSRIVLPAHEIRPFGPLKVYADRIGERRVVYLDHNVWIDLCDGKTPEARECRDLCHRAVEGGRAIFPTSYASVSELLEVPDQPSRVAQAALMDALCLSVTIRASHHVLRLEGEDVYRYLVDQTVPQRRREQVFTSLPDYLGDRPVPFPEGWHAEDVDAFLAYYLDTAGSLRWMVEHMGHEEAARNHARASDYPALIDERRAAHRAHLGVTVVDRDVLAHQERVSLVNSYVLPAIKRLGPPGGDPIRVAMKLTELHRKLHGEDNRNTFRGAFRAAGPTLELTAQIFARQSRDVSRKTTKQDFWDVDHAALAAVYADVLVSGDSYLTEVLRLGDRRPPTALATILSSIGELANWLKHLL